MTFGENLQRLRKEAGLSQEEVAQKLFLSRQSISKWENDAAEPGIENLKALADLYGVTVDELVGRSSQTPPEEAKPDEGGYQSVVALRGVAMVLLGVANMAINGTFTVPFDFIALLVGLWVPHPAVWVSAIVLLAVNMVFGVAALVAEGNVIAPLSIVVCALCAWGLNRPGIKNRFHIRKER